jgi:hypothetical protein
MRACKNCGRDISHRLKPGPGRPPVYCDEIEVPACRYSREIARKRRSDHKKITDAPAELGRVPWGHLVFPGPVIKRTEDGGAFDLEFEILERAPVLGVDPPLLRELREFGIALEIDLSRERAESWTDTNGARKFKPLNAEEKRVRRRDDEANKWLKGKARPTRRCNPVCRNDIPGPAEVATLDDFHDRDHDDDIQERAA